MGRSHVREALTEFNPGHSLSYQLEGSAGPFAVASSRWSSSQGRSGSTMVTVEGRFEPRNAAVPVLLWPLIKPMLKRITTGILLELERFLASGGGDPR